MGDASAIVSWGPGVCEERVAWLLDALIITTCVAAVLVFIMVTCVIYSRGGSWTGTLKVMQNSGAPSKHSHLGPVQGHARAASGSESVDWLRPQLVNTEMTKTWPHLRRLDEKQHCVKCMDQGNEDALCCCAPHCETTHISIAYGSTANEQGKTVLESAAWGAGAGTGVGSVSAAAIALSGGAAAGGAAAGGAAAAAGGAAAGAAAGGATAGGAAASAGAATLFGTSIAGGTELGAVLGPLGMAAGAIAGAGVGAIMVMANPGHGEPKCLGDCGALLEIVSKSSAHLWCECRRAD